jgi:hypothetical protein
LNASLATLNAEKDEKKRADAERKKTETAERAAKQKKHDEEEKAKRESIMPLLQVDVDKGLPHLVKLPKARLLDLLKYFYEDNMKGRSALKKADIVSIVNEKYEQANRNTLD